MHLAFSEQRNVRDLEGNVAMQQTKVKIKMNKLTKWIK